MIASNMYPNFSHKSIFSFFSFHLVVIFIFIESEIQERTLQGFSPSSSFLLFHFISSAFFSLRSENVVVDIGREKSLSDERV